MALAARARHPLSGGARNGKTVILASRPCTVIRERWSLLEDAGRNFTTPASATRGILVLSTRASILALLTTGILGPSTLVLSTLGIRGRWTRAPSTPVTREPLTLAILVRWTPGIPVPTPARTRGCRLVRASRLALCVFRLASCRTTRLECRPVSTSAPSSATRVTPAKFHETHATLARCRCRLRPTPTARLTPARLPLLITSGISAGTCVLTPQPSGRGAAKSRAGDRPGPRPLTVFQKACAAPSGREQHTDKHSKHIRTLQTPSPISNISDTASKQTNIHSHPHRPHPDQHRIAPPFASLCSSFSSSSLSRVSLS